MNNVQNTIVNPTNDSLIQFANVVEQIGSTTKRLEKAAILGSYFASLSDQDLIYAARYSAGYSFPLTDQRTINVGGASLLSALATVADVDPNLLKTELVKLGDLGDVAVVVLANMSTKTLTNQPASGLTLADLAAALDKLAQTQGAKRKQEQLIALLQQATPLEAKYLIKQLSGDLRIGLREGAVEDALARLSDQPVARIQWVNMLLGDIGKTAVLARHHQLDQAKMQLFHPIKFMLASPIEDLTELILTETALNQTTAQETVSAGRFAIEDKYDGIRAQVHIASVADTELLHGAVYDGVRVALFSRTLDEITQSFPDLITPLAALHTSNETELILDGEIVPFQEKQILPFQALQKRLGRKTISEQLLAEVPVAFVAYDLLYCNGAILIDQPYSKRRALLESLPLDTLRVRRSNSQPATDLAAIEAEFLAARNRGNEGLMLKIINSSYKPGRRGREWLKLKRAMATLDVVVTAAEVGTGKRSRFLSDYTFAVRASETDPTLLNVGKAYSGLTDAEVTQLSDWFRAHTLQEFAHGKVRTVEPKIVLEITFDRVQPSKRHKSGYALRFPRILRIRHDKPASEIDTLETVRRLAKIEAAEATEATEAAEAESDG
jgi:DNA ligase-1